MTAYAGTVIDVSKWQTSLPDLTGVLGVIARAGIGTKPDAMFTTHIANARKAGLWVGSYWFNWGTLSVSQQVDAYIAREAEVGGVDLHTIDWEGADGFSAAQTADFIRIYKARTGNLISLYASESRFGDLGQDWDWIANYSAEPSKHYDMWQYGSFRGVDGNHAKQIIVDMVNKETTVTPLAITDTTPKLVAATTKTNYYDLDGVAVVTTKDAGFSERLSPYAAGTLRAIYARVSTDSPLRVFLVHPDTIKDVPSTDDGITQKTVDAAVTAANALRDAEAAHMASMLTEAETAVTQLSASLAAAEAKADLLDVFVSAAKAVGL